MATNDALKAKIREALKQLDHTNNEHWTTDGLPVTAVVQRLTQDGNIKRSDINESAPGFVRKTGDAMGDPPEGLGADPVALAAEIDPLDDLKRPELPSADDEAQAVLAQAVRDAQDAVDAAQLMIKQGTQDERKARKALEQARHEQASRFPPMSQTQSTMQYIATENARRAAEATRHLHQGDPEFRSPLDIAIANRNKATKQSFVRGSTIPAARPAA